MWSSGWTKLMKGLARNLPDGVNLAPFQSVHFLILAIDAIGPLGEVLVHCQELDGPVYVPVPASRQHGGRRLRHRAVSRAGHGSNDNRMRLLKPA
jgi:hypothetical protein